MNVEGFSRQPSARVSELRLRALAGVPLVKQGDDLCTLILNALATSGEKLEDGDLVVLAQKIVSKAQGREIALRSVNPTPRALVLALEVNKDPRLVQLILDESTEIVRKRRDVLIVAHRLGFIMANAGIDMSNVRQDVADDVALLLPLNPDQTCGELRAALQTRTGRDVGIIITDSHGRAFRKGTVGVAIGASGVPTLANLRGRPDLFGRKLQSTEVGLGDEIAAAASLMMGQADEGQPIVLVRGFKATRYSGGAHELIREKETDLFRQPSSDGALRRRRSIRRYTNGAIDDGAIETILETAMHAPSAHNRQPWRFAVVKGKAAKHELASSMAERLRADRKSDGDPDEAIEKDASRSYARITEAPVVIVVCLSMEDMDHYPDARRRAAEHFMAVQGVAMATQNLLLAADQAGLGASIMCAPLFCPETVVRALGLPATWEPQSLITLGHPANVGKPLKRRLASEFIKMIGDGS